MHSDADVSCRENNPLVASLSLSFCPPLFLCFSFSLLRVHIHLRRRVKIAPLDKIRCSRYVNRRRNKLHATNLLELVGSRCACLCTTAHSKKQLEYQIVDFTPRDILTVPRCYDYRYCHARVVHAITLANPD